MRPWTAAVHSVANQVRPLPPVGVGQAAAADRDGLAVDQAVVRGDLDRQARGAGGRRPGEKDAGDDGAGDDGLATTASADACADHRYADHRDMPRTSEPALASPGDPGGLHHRIGQGPFQRAPGHGAEGSVGSARLI